MAKRKTEEQLAREAQTQKEMDAIDNPIELAKWLKSKKMEYVKKQNACLDKIIKLLEEPFAEKDAAAQVEIDFGREEL